MINPIKSLLILAAVVSLSGCLKVDDKGSKNVAAALEQQNQTLSDQNKILQQQADQAAQTKTSLAVTGTVKNLSTDSAATDATVTLKTGTVTTSATASADGTFQIDNVPLDSDYTLIVHSASGAFMDRTFFGATRNSTSSGNIYQDLGQLTVAAGIEHKYKILNSVTNASVTGLNLYANSEVGTASGYEQYLHKSTYDATTQEYKITLPEHLGVSVHAALDLNNDGRIEYKPENNMYGYYDLSISDTDNHNTIYLVDLLTNKKVEVRVSLVDSFLQPILGAAINVDDNLNGSVSGSYDATTNQYVIDAVMDSNLMVMIPSFTVGTVTYSSSTVQINAATGTEFSAYVSGNNSYTAQFSFDQAADKVFDVVLRPSSLNLYSYLSSVGIVSTTNQSNTAFNVFYSGAVALKSDSVSLVKKNVLSVVRGDDSATDLILPGTTAIEMADQPVAIDTQTSLNNTLVTATTKAPLEGGYTYSFSIDTLKDLFANVDANPYGDSMDITVPSTAAFSINDIQLDNNDYFTNGAVIKPVNTAGVTASPYSYSWGSSVNLYLPASIENLKTLTLRKEQVTNNGVTTNSVDTFNIVVNGAINYYYRSQLVSLAENEYVTGNWAYSSVHGAGIADGGYYSFNTYEYLPDNTASSANSITFTYTYETKDGTVSTGSITLPVH